MEFGQVIEYNKIKFFFKYHAENEAGSLVPGLYLFSYKSFIWGKSKCTAALFRYVSIAFILAYSKSKQYKTLDYESSDMVKFDFLEKDQGIVYPIHFVYDFSIFVYDFSIKPFLMLFSINWSNFIKSLLI